MDNPNHKGNVAELAIATEAARLGLSVLKPLTEHERYDLVLGIGGRLPSRPVQVGETRVREVIQVRLRSSYHSPTRGYVVATYDEIGDRSGRRLLRRPRPLLPLASQAVRWAEYGAILRLEPTQNNQRAALNWARQYEFPGAVAQLAERSDGIRKVRGSIPLSSTSSWKSRPTPPLKRSAPTSSAITSATTWSVPRRDRRSSFAAAASPTPGLDRHSSTSALALPMT